MELRRVLVEQDGVVSRRHVAAGGRDDSFIEMRLRRMDRRRVNLGVYVDHTGPLSWRQRVWEAVLFGWSVRTACRAPIARLLESAHASGRRGGTRVP